MTMLKSHCECGAELPWPKSLTGICDSCLDKEEARSEAESKSKSKSVKEMIDTLGFDHVLLVMSDYASDVADSNAGKGGSIGSRRAFNKVSGLLAVCADDVAAILKRDH